MQNSDRTTVFIAFEGIDGSGKSTQLRMLADTMAERQLPVHRTFEPTDNPIGAMIRAIFGHKMDADHKTIAGLFVADRLHHLLEKDKGILAILQKGVHVLTDRYYFSSYAYHSVHMSMDWVISANAMSAELRRPDLTLFIDVPPEVAMRRIQQNRTEIELYETLDNLRQVRDKYLEAFDRLQNEERVMKFDGTLSPENLHKSIWEAVSHLF